MKLHFESDGKGGFILNLSAEEIVSFAKTVEVLSKGMDRAIERGIEEFFQKKEAEAKLRKG